MLGQLAKQSISDSLSTQPDSGKQGDSGRLFIPISAVNSVDDPLALLYSAKRENRSSPSLKGLVCCYRPVLEGKIELKFRSSGSSLIVCAGLPDHPDIVVGLKVARPVQATAA